MIDIDPALQPGDLLPAIRRMWSISGRKIRDIENNYPAEQGSPVFTVGGKYTARGWTEWTQGFVYGSALLQFEAGDDSEFLDIGRRNTLEKMAVHVTHFGVHDHGFNNISTYGNLLRLLEQGRLPEDPWQRHFYRLALKCSGAVQARRWTALPEGGFIYSFNGPHSLFADTIRSLRVLAVAHQLGHRLRGEQEQSVSLLERLIQHARSTSRWNVYFGTGRDAFDQRGRVAHESIFNLNNGCYRCPSSQQGYSPFSTWTRGLAWILCGFAEQLEFLADLPDDELEPFGGRQAVEKEFLHTAEATADFYIEQTPTDGIPYWDTGAPNLHRLGDCLMRPAEPNNDWEPVDSSAAAIAAQGLLRLGQYLLRRNQEEAAARFRQAGLTVLRTLLQDSYLGLDPEHQGLLLHALYHHPNGWDTVPEGSRVPNGEACIWGDYHLREVALLTQRLAETDNHPTFYL